MKKLRIVINAQLPGGGFSGGIEQFLIGLAHALGKLSGPEEYVFVGPTDDSFWLAPYLGSNGRVVPATHRRRRPEPFTGRALRRARGIVDGRLLGVKESKSIFDALGSQVVHFPFQSFAHTVAPSIFNPHDLQHLHFPEFFTSEDYAKRERLYPDACRSAAAVVVESQWIKDDIVGQYGIDPEKIHVILWGAPTEAYEPPLVDAVRCLRQDLGLPSAFALYPAQTWAHKNHIRLAQALRLLRDREGIRVDVVCTGTMNAHWPTIQREVERLGLEDQMRFLGFVSPQTLRALYAAAQFLVFPSLFEGGGFPILEAFYEGTPVACSNVTSLPEYAGDAALLFDPASVERIASAIHRLTLEPGLRSALRDKGSMRIERFTWKRAATGYRAIYRSLAGGALSEEDRSLLAQNR